MENSATSVELENTTRAAWIDVRLSFVPIRRVSGRICDGCVGKDERTELQFRKAKIRRTSYYVSGGPFLEAPTTGQTLFSNLDASNCVNSARRRYLWSNIHIDSTELFLCRDCVPMSRHTVRFRVCSDFSCNDTDTNYSSTTVVTVSLEKHLVSNVRRPLEEYSLIGKKNLFSSR